MKLTKLMGDGEQSWLIHLSEEQLLECQQNMIRVWAFRAEIVRICLYWSDQFSDEISVGFLFAGSTIAS